MLNSFKSFTLELQNVSYCDTCSYLLKVLLKASLIFCIRGSYFNMFDIFVDFFNCWICKCRSIECFN